MRIPSSKIIDLIKGPRPKASVGKMIKVLAGGRHALYETNVGPRRKPYPLTKKS